MRLIDANTDTEMSVELTNEVDAIGVDNATGDVILTIADHLEWAGDEKEHLLLLQEKLNTYLSFVESGELLETYPKAKDRTVLIEVVCKYPLPQQAEGFYSQVAQIIESAGIKFRHQLFNADYKSSGN